MAGELIVGLDIGTTGCKAALFDDDGTLISSASAESKRRPVTTPKTTRLRFACMAWQKSRRASASPSRVWSISVNRPRAR